MIIHDITTKNYTFNEVVLLDNSSIDNFVNVKAIEATSWAKRVVEFRKPLEALEYFRKMNNHPNLMPEVILLDLSMPKMSGEEFLQAIKELSSVVINPPEVIILSAYLRVEMEIALKAKYSLVAECLEKPLLPSKLRYLNDMKQLHNTLAS